MTHPKSDKPLRPDLQQVLESRAAILDDARPKAVAQQRKRGRWTAREGIAALVDRDSFVEYGGLARPAVVRRTRPAATCPRRPARTNLCDRRPRR